MGDQGQIVLRRFAETYARIQNNFFLRNTRCLCRIGTYRQIARDFIHHIDISRGDIGAADFGVARETFRCRAVMHQHNGRATARGDFRHARILSQGGNIIQDRRPCAQGLLRDFGLQGIDRDQNRAEFFLDRGDHRHNAAGFFLNRNGNRAGARAFAADIQNIRAVSNHLRRLRNGARHIIGLRHNTIARKRIRRDI